MPFHFDLPFQKSGSAPNIRQGTRAHGITITYIRVGNEKIDPFWINLLLRG